MISDCLHQIQLAIHRRVMNPRAAETNIPPTYGLEPEALADLSVDSASASGSEGTFPSAACLSIASALLWGTAAMFLVIPRASLADERADFFETNVRPLFLDKCIECHGPTKQENGVRLDRRADVLSGKAGDTALIHSGSPKESRLFAVLQHATDDIAMPPAGKLAESQIAAIEKWITDGAIWPETSNLESEAKSRSEKWRQHWAFQPVQKADLSQVPADTNPVDYFVRQKLAAKGLQLSLPTEAKTLVRRLSFALTGLPPETSDLNAATDAVKKKSWSAWKTEYIDRLLASPQFGERWGRYWLDVSRYADTKGYVFTEDREYPDAWRYREWVIRSIDSDMPYDEFLKRQLAADQMPGSDDPAQLAAMGYLTLGRRFLNNTHDIIDDRIDVVSRGMLGLTASCARCHDHKFDPIPTADYYSMYGVFASSDEPKNEPSTLRLVDRAQPVEPVIFRRGSPGNRGDPVPRRFFTALSKPDATPFKTGSGRLELAGSIADRNNPLTGRVAANRVWMHLFGRGLVDSPSDFGVRTEAPAHLDLLDFLTISFMDHNWSLKSLVRQIVTSETWQQRSDRRRDAESVDPENRLLARMNRMRLDFEAQRDAVLAVSGRLDRTIGGKSADIAADPNSFRRTIYARIDRQNLPGIFRTFDLPNPDAHAAQRFQTTVPQQALFQLNNAFEMNRAVDLAESTKAAGSENDLTPRIRQLFQTILQREPAIDEITNAAVLVRQVSQRQNVGGGTVGWNYGYGTLNEATGQVTKFAVLPFAGEGTWKGGNTLPDATLGWTSLNKEGGHPGGTPDLCAIRRWTAEVDCRVIVAAVISHSNAEGDGVRFRVVTRNSVVADVTSHNDTKPTQAATLDLKAGESIDFVTSCGSNEAHDSFKSRIFVTQSVNGKVQRVWNSIDDFRDQPGSTRLDAWAQLAQALLLSNEFVFVD